MGRKSHPHKQPQKQGPAKSWNGPVSVALARLAFAARAGDAQRVANAMIQRGELAADGPFLDKHIPLGALIYVAWDLGLENKPYGPHTQYDVLIGEHPQRTAALEYIASLAESMLNNDSLIEQLAREVMDIAVDGSNSMSQAYDLSGHDSVGDFLDQPEEWRDTHFSGFDFAARAVSDPIDALALQMVNEALTSAAETAAMNVPPELQDFFRLAAGNADAYHDFVIMDGYEVLSEKNCSSFDLVRTVAAMDFCKALAEFRPDAVERLNRDIARREEDDLDVF